MARGLHEDVAERFSTLSDLTRKQETGFGRTLSDVTIPDFLKREDSVSPLPGDELVKGAFPKGSTCRSSSSSTASTRTPSSSDSSKKCTLCNSAYTGFGQVCFHCRKSGSRGSACQCQQCGEYFQGFGTACHDCRDDFGEELMG